MPTDVISKIGATNSPVTMDYTSLQAWEDACPANLVSDDKRWIGECYDQGEFVTSATALTIAGITSDSTRYPILRCAAGASFRDKAGVRTTPLMYNASNGVAIRKTGNYTPAVLVQVPYTRLDGLQIKTTGTNSAYAVFHQAGTSPGTCYYDNLILETSGNGIAMYAYNASSANPVMRQCLMVVGASGTGLFSAFSAECYGCGVVRSGGGGIGVAYRQAYGSIRIKNCWGFGLANFKTGSAGDNGSGYNATDLSSAYGSNNQTSLTFADQVENTSNDFRAKSTGGLKHGTPDSTNSPTDITGLARDATTPWIGPWEVAAAATGSGPLIGRSRLTRSVLLGRKLVLSN